MFHRTLAVDGESKQRLVAFSLLLSVDDSVPQLWQDALDFVHLPVFGAFQIVLLYLFGQSIIAVDMFLNLVTTNSSEAMELLDNLLPAIVTVVILYIPALILGMISIIRKRRLSVAFIRRERKRAFILLGISLLTLGGAYWEDSRYELKSDLYPLNVCYNVGLAFQRTALTQNYHHTSKDFTFHAQATHPADKREVYVMVVGETSRALNWQLYGYERETNPLLSRQPGIVAFSKVLTESNTTHKSVPMLMSDITACNFDSIYHQKESSRPLRRQVIRQPFSPTSAIIIPLSISSERKPIHSIL